MKKLLKLCLVLGLVSPLMAGPTFSVSDLANIDVIDYLGALAPAVATAWGPGYSQYGSLATSTQYDPGVYSKPGDLAYYPNTSVDIYKYMCFGIKDYDITGLSSFEITLNNVNDDIWGVSAYAYDVSGGAQVVSDLVTLQPYATSPYSTTLTVSLATMTDNTVDLGFLVTYISDSKGEYSPGGDQPHISVSVVPVPGAILLTGMGTGLVGLVRGRRLA